MQYIVRIYPLLYQSRASSSGSKLNERPLSSERKLGLIIPPTINKAQSNLSEGLPDYYSINIHTLAFPAPNFPPIAFVFSRFTRADYRTYYFS